ncbi:uncharacterized protein N7496_006602 [Penicillium cataractarum]|uniref:Xaa-Pro dipeptidyl-peptidase C-terminal domain-containing protein n=1 Tax=Penicillium cataractarum TaxID=2100454 RepID=A0A9W9V8P1_9EURO|nr:uncharacterized protein N7496_006602 [Penicillium cataractarum]KAJ5370510.1 hypothetical protein N7496_006602 [Penicillium cataractarum]
MPAPVQVAYTPIHKPRVGENNYQGFAPGRQEILPKGWKLCHETKALTEDLLVEHDVEIVVRDGCRLYVDIYRPANSSEKVPAIMGWSCYGKKYSSYHMFPRVVWNVCVNPSDLSGLEKFEGLDPQLWCPRGYAIISVDSRGTGNSDGQIPLMGSQDGEDGYDVVEAIAAKPWCNGRVGLAGNSALAISQWFTAQLAPPSLAAIAPWEGAADIFREQFCRGGIFSMSNFEMITEKSIRGGSGVEDLAEMYRRCKTSNTYWEDKRADMSNIQCPTFIVGSDLSSIHTMGSIRGWMEITHANKWIRWSGYQEWFELYCNKEMDAELHQFFDRYLIGIENDWEKTPQVRWTSLQFGDRNPRENLVYDNFPIPQTDYRELFLHENTLIQEPASSASSLSYNSEDPQNFAEFSFTFTDASRLIGLPKATLYMSCKEHDDMCVYVIIRKKGRDGTPLMHLNFPREVTPVQRIADIKPEQRTSTTLFLGPTGQLRASHRNYDLSKSIHPQFPFHPHDTEDKVTPGEIVKLEIGIWSMGIDFEAGETISIRVGGVFPSIAEYSAYHNPRPEEERNKGVHTIHFGPEHRSSIILPFIPLK